jgi:hypothetical protein
MTTRMLAIDLRRGPAPVLALALLVLGGAQILGGSVDCGAGWPDVALAVRDGMWLAFPCVLAAGVWRGGAARRRQLDGAIRAASLPRRRRSAVEGGSLGLAGIAALALLLVTATAAGGCAPDGLRVDSAAAGLAGGAALVAAAFAGLALGRVAPAPLAAPLALFLALAVGSVFGGWAPGDDAAMLLLPGLGEGVGAGDLELRATMAQLCWFAGLAITGWLAAGAGSRRSRLTAPLPALAGLAALFALAG